jgi:hypothetical protein
MIQIKNKTNNKASSKKIEVAEKIIAGGTRCESWPMSILLK